MPEQNSHGVISHENSTRPTDYLYRISIKCLVRNEDNVVLVVKEIGRDWWDLPGGGMDHGENIRSAIAREMKEEVNLNGDFTYKIIHCEDPGYLSAQSIWQVRLVFEVIPENVVFSPGTDADEVAFMDPDTFKNSKIKTERRIYNYASSILNL